MERIQSAIAKARATRGDAPEQLKPEQRSDGGATAAPRNTRTQEAWSALPVMRPDLKRLEKNRIVALSGGQDAITIDMLRTKVLQQMRANNWRRLAITSPTAGCGKTTVSLNLAFSLARQTELRSVLCELDLRRPSMAKVLGLRESHSMAKVLEGTARFQDNALRYGDNLAVATNASVWRNPAELLHSSSVGTTLREIETTYAPDIMIFDVPPMMVADDAVAFFPRVDAVLLVAAAEHTKIKEIDTCERDIAGQTNVMGVILNKCRYVEQSYGYGYYG